MRNLFLGIFFAIFCGCLSKTTQSTAMTAIDPTNAPAGTTLYYIGESFITMASGEVYKSPYIITRTSNQNNHTIVEKVVSRHATGFGENESTLVINHNHFTMTESTGTVTGEGDFTGESWKWTFLRAEFQIQGGMRIVDYNFFADPNSIMGHKDFFVPDSGTAHEKLSMQEDVVLHVTDKDTFVKKRSELLNLQ